jgi:hypothetical protein
MFVMCVVCYQVEVSATSWSLVRRSPTDCGASLCVINKPRERGGHSPRWAAEPEKVTIIITMFLLLWAVWHEVVRDKLWGKHEPNVSIVCDCMLLTALIEQSTYFYNYWCNW